MLTLKFGDPSPEDLRNLGFMVAVHNDYRLQGRRMTFWLMTIPQGEDLPDLAFKGEGFEDRDALDVIRQKVLAYATKVGLPGVQPSRKNASECPAS